MKIMSELDEDQDGKLSYTEFLPFTVELLQTLHAKHEVDAAKAREAESARCAQYKCVAEDTGITNAPC